MGRGRCDAALTTVAKHTLFMRSNLIERKRGKKNNESQGGFSCCNCRQKET